MSEFTWGDLPLGESRVVHDAEEVWEEVARAPEAFFPPVSTVPGCHRRIRRASGRASGRGRQYTERPVGYMERDDQRRPHADGNVDRGPRPDERHRHRNVDTRRRTGQNGGRRRMVSGKVARTMGRRLASGRFWQKRRVFRYVDYG